VASALFDDGREGFLDGTIRWGTGVIAISLLRATVAPNLATAKFVSDVLAGGGSPTLVATQVLGTKTVTDGVADAADVNFPAVGAGAAIQYLLIYQRSNPDGTGDPLANTAQRVIALIDDYTGLPVTPNGGDIAVQFSSGANRIFKL
jgi:hypothetical protein